MLISAQYLKCIQFEIVNDTRSIRNQQRATTFQAISRQLNVDFDAHRQTTTEFQMFHKFLTALKTHGASGNQKRPCANYSNHKTINNRLELIEVPLRIGDCIFCRNRNCKLAHHVHQHDVVIASITIHARYTNSLTHSHRIR